MSTATFYLSGSNGERLFERKLNATKVTPKSLGALLRLVAASICLYEFSEGNIIEQEDGAFSQPLLNGMEYEVAGDPIGQAAPSDNIVSDNAVLPSASGQVASKLSFTKDQIKTINSHITLNTAEMMKSTQNIAMAPECVLILQGILTVANCTDDFSMSNEKTLNVIKLMTSPSSFKGTLVQIANSATSAFLQADKIMGQIKAKLSNVPGFLLSSLEAGSLPNDPSAVEMLNMNREEIEIIAKYCAEQSTEVASAFLATQALIAETLQAAAATDGFKNDELTKIIADLKASEIEQKQLKEEQRKNKDDLQIQKKRTSEARKTYMKNADKMGDLGFLFVASMLDGVHNVAGRVAGSAGDICNAVVNNVTGNHIYAFKGSSNGTQELNMVQGVEYYCAKELPSTLEEMRRVANEDKEYIAAFTNLPTSKTAKVLWEHCKKYVKLLDKIFHEGSPADFDKVKAQVQIMQVTAAGLRRECEEQINAQAQRMKTTEGVLKQLNASAAQAQSDYKDERAREDELKKKATEFTRELASLNIKLTNSKTEKVEIDEAIKYLSKGIEMLSKMNQAWLSLAHFFTTIQTLVSSSIKDSLELYLKTQAISGRSPQNDLVRRKLIETAIQASGLVRHAIFGVDLYQDISRQYVMPDLGGICTYLTLSKDEAKKKLKLFEWNFDHRRAEIQACIKSSKTDAFKQVDEATIACIDKLAITEN